MFYHILFPLRNIFSPFNVFQYITFRSFAAIFTSFLFTVFFMKFFMQNLSRRGIGQHVRSDGPETHLSKEGTPTMGGIALLISILLSTFLWARLDNRFILWLLGGVLFLGLLGFADDYLKLVKKNPIGLPARKKLIGQFLLAGTLAAYLWIFPSNSGYLSRVNIPYLKEVYVNFGYLYIAFVIFIVLGASNGVNLTDGLDGLAISNLIIVSFTYSIFAYLAGNFKFSNYLKVIYVPGAGEISVYLAAVMGSGLGFLWYNSYPAQIFMGDTGSLFLGGSLGMVAVFIKQEILLVIIGGVFVAEVLSVILQVHSFRTSGKRIFKMAPLHHHFELSGWSEPKVTIRFVIISVMLSLIALTSLKLR